MTRPVARDALTIFVDGDEVPGLIAYGLLPPRLDPALEFPAAAWIARPEPRSFTLHGTNWEIVGWEVPVVVWPNAAQFGDAVRDTLAALIAAGSRMAWIGAEGLPFCDPPALFDPDCMSGGVLAWMDDSGQFDCPLEPDAALSPIDDKALLRLRVHAAGLADAT